MKRAILAVFLLVIISWLGRQLNPYTLQMFTFHDQTQPARLHQFIKNLFLLNLPPRIAIDFNYGLGYPVFNFYAPAAYWLTSVFNIIGFDIVGALKLSFLTALVIGFIGAYCLFNLYFSFFPGLIAAVLYVTGLYFPLDIFVRGNLAELWFLAVLPFSFFLINKQAQLSDQKIFLTTTIILFFLLTCHNLYSLIFIPLILIYIFLYKKIKLNLISFFLAAVLSAYFWLPVIVESPYVWAQTVARQTVFRDHFLCLTQLWQSPWGFGGSTKGCLADGMSFMIGKPQLIFFFFGLATAIYQLLFKKKDLSLTSIYFLITVLLFIFLTTSYSQPVWEISSPVTAIIQFPWRLIGLSLVGIAYFTSYFFEHLKFAYKNIIIIVISLLIIVVNGKYFYGQNVPKPVFEKKYLSADYIRNTVAYKIPEYLPIATDYYYWRSLEGKPVTAADLAAVNLSPFTLAQTSVEKASNFITIFGVVLLILSLNKRLWKRIR